LLLLSQVTNLENTTGKVNKKIYDFETFQPQMPSQTPAADLYSFCLGFPFRCCGRSLLIGLRFCAKLRLF
jgi:hypothetical protein